MATFVNDRMLYINARDFCLKAKVKQEPTSGNLLFSFYGDAAFYSHVSVFATSSQALEA